MLYREQGNISRQPITCAGSKLNTGTTNLDLQLKKIKPCDPNLLNRVYVLSETHPVHLYWILVIYSCVMPYYISIIYNYLATVNNDKAYYRYSQFLCSIAVLHIFIYLVSQVDIFPTIRPTFKVWLNLRVSFFRSVD